MGSEELRKRFLEFFQKYGHTIVPSSSLVPDDPSVLLTTAGMQQFKPYYTGQADPFVSSHPTLGGKPLGSKNAASIQKSFRTSDIDEVGDESHLTFFEMMGNFSFGGYSKEDAIRYAHEFITKVLKLNISYVTVFKGLGTSGVVPKDEGSKRIWESLGISDSDIREEGLEDNFWGPTGNEGPCGPTTEIYCKNSEGKDIEIWNIVFNEFYCFGSHSQLLHAPETIKLKDLDSKGIDTGMGLERLAMVSQQKANVFQTDLLEQLTEIIPTDDERLKRIIADHVRASVHLIADGVEPSNKGKGYILRRLLRRAAFHAIDIASEQAKAPLSSATPKSWNERASIAEIAVVAVNASYFGISEKKDFILAIINKEVGGFIGLLRSRKELDELIHKYSESSKSKITGEDAFKLFSTFGIPIDYVKDEAKKAALEVDIDGFEKAYIVHQEISRAGLERKFGGHGLLLDTGELKAANEEELKIVTRLHTATHLLQSALRKVLGDTVHQAGSDITAERLRFDFTFDRKLAPEEIKLVEDWVNQVVQKDVPMGYQEMPYEEAIKTRALYFEKEKYPPMVKVYSAADPNTGEVFSKELCGGPHVTHTGEVGHFKILKEEAVGAGIRRLRATVE